MIRIFGGMVAVCFWLFGLVWFWSGYDEVFGTSSNLREDVRY